MSSNWNAFLDRRIEVGRELTREEHRLLDVLMRSILGWNRTEEFLGEGLLRQETGLHGRSFGRARDGLIAEGLVEYAPPQARGRAHRGHYRLILGGAAHDDDDDRGSPAQERDIPHDERPADQRVFPLVTPAESPAETPAPERGRIEEGVKNDDVLIDALLEGFGRALKSQRRLFADALASNPHGFLACRDEARGGENPIALLTSLIKDGAHRSAAVNEEPLGSASRLDTWLTDIAQRLNEDDVSVVLTDSFGLTGDEHAEAMQTWRKYRDSQKTEIE